MFRIAIVEDQGETRECLNRFVRQYAEEQGVQVEISLITDGSEIAEHYTPGFDIIFMDVEMPWLDGFAAAEAIRAVDAEVVLVFVTNMAQYAIRGYEVDALDYVLKPVNYYQFCTKLSRAIQRVQRRRGGQVVLQLAGGGIQLLSGRYSLRQCTSCWHGSCLIKKGTISGPGSCSVRSSLASCLWCRRRCWTTSAQNSFRGAL